MDYYYRNFHWSQTRLATKARNKLHVQIRRGDAVKQKLTNCTWAAINILATNDRHRFVNTFYITLESARSFDLENPHFKENPNFQEWKNRPS